MTGGKGPRLTIGAGLWKGRALEVPAAARPTSGRARAALFSILHDTVVDASVLDLYAGSGAVGLEAVSRGARRAVLVEEDATAAERNVRRLDPDEQRVRVLRAEATRALPELDRRGERFEIVFADPPYADELPPGFLEACGALLSPGGLLVLQRDDPARTPAEPRGMALVERRRYGRNVFCFYAQAGSSLDLCAPEEL